MQDASKIYDDKYRTIVAQRRNLALWHHEALSFLKALDRNQSLLEIGCGDGRLLEPISELGFEALGIDVSAEAVAQCRTKGLKAEQVDVTKELPYEEEFDICVSIYVLVTIDNRRQWG